MTTVQRKILHVDDEPQITDYIAGLLEKQGYSVTSLNHPARTLEEIARTGARVVLLDVDMPGVDGVSLLEEIKAFDGTLQVIMLTGLTTLATTVKTLRRGAEACYFKPLDDVPSFLETLDHTFRKLDKWQKALKHVCNERYTGVAAGSIAVPDLATAAVS